MTATYTNVILVIGWPIVLTTVAIAVLRYSAKQKASGGFERAASTGTGAGLSKFVADNAAALATASVIAIVFVMMVLRPLQYLRVHDESAPFSRSFLRGTLRVDSHNHHLDSGDTFEAVLDVTALQAVRACRPRNLAVTLAAPSADVTLVQRLDIFWPTCHGRSEWLVAPRKSGRLLIAASLVSSDARRKKSYDAGSTIVAAQIASDSPLSDGLLGAFVTLLSGLIVVAFPKSS